MSAAAILDREVNARNLFAPDMIAATLNNSMRAVLRQTQVSESGNQDGMDASICTVYHDEGIMEYVGANRALLRNIQNSEFDIIEPTSVSLGGNFMKVDKTVFQKHQIPMDGTKVFLFSKGLENQEGGIKSAKFGIKNIQEEFLQNLSTPLKDMAKHFDESIENWMKMAGQKQADDILLLGIDLSS